MDSFHLVSLIGLVVIGVPAFLIFVALPIAVIRWLWRNSRK